MELEGPEPREGGVPGRKSVGLPALWLALSGEENQAVADGRLLPASEDQAGDNILTGQNDAIRQEYPK
jgi:hypothetical protein